MAANKTSFFNNWCQKKKKYPVTNIYSSVGPNLQPLYTCDVRVDDVYSATSSGHCNKKDAKHHAIKKILQQLVANGVINAKAIPPDESIEPRTPTPPVTKKQESSSTGIVRDVTTKPAAGESSRDSANLHHVDTISLEECGEGNHGNWTLENSLPILEKIFSVNNIDSEFKYSVIGIDGRSICAEKTIFVRDLDRNLYGCEFGETKHEARLKCVLSIVRMLYHSGIINEFNGSPKMFKKKRCPVVLNPKGLQQSAVTESKSGCDKDWLSQSSQTNVATSPPRNVPTVPISNVFTTFLRNPPTAPISNVSTTFLRNPPTAPISNVSTTFLRNPPTAPISNVPTASMRNMPPAPLGDDGSNVLGAMVANLAEVLDRNYLSGVSSDHAVSSNPANPAANNDDLVQACKHFLTSYEKLNPGVLPPNKASTSTAMASRGRGIRRDGQKPNADASVRWQSPLDALAVKITMLDCKNVAELQEIEGAIRKYCTDVEKLRLLIDDLHERSLADAEFGVRAAASLATTAQLTVENVKLRNILIQNLQKDFTQADKLCTVDQPRFLNAVSFLGEITFRVKLANSLPIAVLSGAHITYQKKLLEGNSSAHELFVNMWAQHGAELFATQPSDGDELLRLIFSKCMQEETSAYSRAWLMLAIELFHADFKSLPDRFINIFEPHLGKDALTQIQAALSSEVAESVEQVYEDAVESPQPTVVPQRPPVAPQTTLAPQTTVCRPPLTSPRDRRETQQEKDSVFARLGMRPEDSRQARGDARKKESDNWLPYPERTEADIEKWGLQKSGGKGNWRRGGEHDDRCERDYYKEANAYAASKQPLPGNDENWD